MKKTLMVFVALLLTACYQNHPRPMTIQSFHRSITPTKVNFINTNEIVLRSISLTIATDNTDRTLDSVLQIATNYGGRVLRSDAVSANFKVNDSVYLTVLSEIEKLGIIIAENISGNDAAFDLDLSKKRLKNARENLNRCINAIDSSRDISNVASITREISKLTNEVITHEYRVQKLETSDIFTNFAIRVRLKHSSGPLGWFFTKLYKGVKWLFIQP